MKWLLSFTAAFFFALSALAQVPPAAPQQKIDELVRLLQDPEVKAWLDSRKQESGAAAPASPAGNSALANWEAGARAQVHAVLTAIPAIPAEVAAAATRARREAASRGYAPVFLIFSGLVAFGLAAEAVYRRFAAPREALLGRLIPIGVFAGAMGIVFFAVEWPPLARVTLLAYLSAFILFRLAAALLSVAAMGSPLRRRLLILLGVICFAVATAAVGGPLGVSPEIGKAISYCFSVVGLLLAIEAAWSVWEGSRARKAAVTAFLVALWLVWCINMRGLFWIGVYALVLPGILNAVGRAALSFTDDPGSLRGIVIARGARAAVIALAVGWLALVWEFNPDALGQRDPTIVALFYGGLKSVLILVVADLLWQVARGWIDRTLRISTSTTSLAPADAARRARFRTLLPIFRHALAVAVAIMAGLIVLAQLGVQIGPLIAGAGIFGVAIGFGSQTLVKDIINGVFYMLDDAFRVGEYIQAKDYKGTVESFSLRSVRLRHHRGPVYTVPFSELGAVENMSRDWVIDKFRITVGFDTDIDKARKLTKKVGAELIEDPELGKQFLEPLKMKGVEQFGDYGIVLSFAMTTVPGMQTYIRRKAYAKIREVFLANGIAFAQPTIQVGGDDKGSGAAAAAQALRTQQANAATPAK
ncbi:small-conductance mechanosensitive channel [Rhizobium binae]|uniref:Small-conductance mechanosensitive channel n=1 Tax=Rhizobium binae TaxID=1138190 RepID=A0ABV2MJ29_9HYPH|nr:mechanosensitive ion channel family protein [Rhizobium binae]NKL48118.1 mechanosensitive ion channel [Rhizobium leguminosarum bv. viciae]MBX4929357.1 mechanosensitive ion channel family protein [Rhizobium binae]MBX4952824.1 mechanosensitive ion channel family protein [Rhizobium binae]MBX4990555.1 mechanosensitive ion channel family protein [Rhizobium binae]QSY82381.1 mechanosensitive ion channel family protein [Rhizobium binae]